MRGEFRAAALNLANATDGPMRARLHFEGLPGSPAPGYVAVAEVPWTDTAEGQPVAAALPEVQPQADGWPIAVLPGMVRQVWMTVHATDVEPGTHAGTAVVTCEGQEPLRIPVELHVYPVDVSRGDHVVAWAVGVTPTAKASTASRTRIARRSSRIFKIGSSTPPGRPAP